MKITVDATKPEIDALEDLATVWILCKKHNALTIGKNDVEIYKMQNACKDCLKEVKRISGRGVHLWSKMIHAYYLAKYGKCCDECKEGLRKLKTGKKYKSIFDVYDKIAFNSGDPNLSQKIDEILYVEPYSDKKRKKSK